MTTTLPLFWHLSSASKKERIDASVKLVGALEQFQAQFLPKDPSLGNSGSEEEKNEEYAHKSDELDVFNAQDVSYSIRRLVRGLASPRESSRLGFAVALTELLSRIDTITCSQIITLIIDGTKSQGSMTGQEERDVLFARLFGLTAIIQSGLLVRAGALVTSASSTSQASTLSGYEETITQLLALGEKKSWLRESAWWTITLAIDVLGESDVTWKKDAVDVTIQQLFIDNKDWSPEKVALALKLQNLHPDQDWQKLLLPSFKDPDLLNTANLHNLGRILKESAMDEDDVKGILRTSAGSWKPQLHFVWDIILDQLLPGPNSPNPPRGSFQEFFRIVVDESLFSSTSSPQRKYSGFQVFQKALQRVTQDNMPMLFTKNFMRSWINHLSHRDRYLHKIATQAATEVQSFVQSSPQLGFALILQLIGVNGNQQFDKLTKTKTIETILTSMDAAGIKDYIDYLFMQVDSPEDRSDIQALNTRRSWIIEQLGALIHSGAIPKSDEWVQSILDWLVINGLFAIKKGSGKGPLRRLRSIPSPMFSDELRHKCRTRLLSSLGDLSAQSTIVKAGDKSTKAFAQASDGEFWVSKVLTTIGLLEKDTKHVSLLSDLGENDLVLCTKAHKVAARLKNISDSRQETAKGAELLLLATILQQYCKGDQQTMDSEALEACVESATRMFPEGKRSKKSRKSTSDYTEAAPEPIDVFVDTIISFLEKSTAYMRTIGNQVFALLSSAVQETTIDLIVTQLERRNPEELAAGEDEGMEDSEEDSEDGGLSGDGSESDEDEGDDTNQEDVDLELRNKIQDALQVNGNEAPADDSDEEEELMDDEQMMAIDEQLAEVFRSRVNEKKSGKGLDTQREATHFKNRVLDLVDVFVKKQPSSPHIIRLISPLIELIAGTSLDERQLSDKAKGILKSRIGKLKEVPSGVEPEKVLVVLNELHTRARKVHSSDLLATLNQCSLYLSKVLLHLDAEKSLLHTYRQSLADFITRKNSALNASFFQDFIRRYPIPAWYLRSDLLDLSSRAVNVYRQCQAFQLMEVLVSRLPAMGSEPPNDGIEFMTSLRKALLEAMSNGCDEKITLTNSQMKELLKIGLVAIRQTQRISSSRVQEIWQPDSWTTLSKRLATSARFKTSPALQKMCQQAVRLSKPTTASRSPEKTEVAIIATSKRKAEGVADTEGAIMGMAKLARKKVKIDKS